MNDDPVALKQAGQPGTLAGTVAVAAFASLLLATAALMTRVDFFKTGDDGGFWHARVIDACLVMPPIAALLLAHAPGWWRQGLRERAAFALAALPAWAIALRMIDSVIANDVWVLVVLMPLQGIQPFGAAS